MKKCNNRGFSLVELLIGMDHRHQGIIAEIIPKEALTESDLWILLDNLSHPPFVLILDNVTDPHNVGACLRSAEAFGVDIVIAPESKACGLTPVVRKVSSGSSERIPFVQVVNLARVLEKLKSRGIWLSGLDGEATQTLAKADFKGALGIIMGAEGEGIRRLTKEHCDFLIKIPMTGQIESLNVSVATGIVLYAAHIQRSK